MMRRQPALLALLITLAVAAAYWPLWQNGFVTFDDPDYLTENAGVLGGLTLHGVRWAFTTFHAGNWHPVTWLGHMSAVELFGQNPAGHHGLSLLLHAGNALLLFFVLDRLTGFPRRSAAVALLFALHPLHVESVAWASELKDLLCAFFFLLALGAWGRYAQRPGAGRYAAVLVLTALALMAKPMAVTLPPLFLLLDWWPLRRFPARLDAAGLKVLGRLLLEKLPPALLAAGGATLTWRAQHAAGMMNPLDGNSLLLNAGNALITYAAYLGKMCWPAGLAVPYPFSAAAVTPVRVALAALLLLAVTLVAAVQRHRRPWLAAGWFWYLGTLVPVIGIVSVGAQAMADRYTYLPLVGIFVIVVWGGAELGAAFSLLRAPLAASFLMALVACGVLTARQTGYWHDSATLYRHALAVTRDNWVAHNNLGIVLAKEGDGGGAFRHFSAAIGINPDYAAAHNNLGNVFLDHLHNSGRAIGCFREALRLDPAYTGARFNLGRALLVAGDRQGALAEYRFLLAADPDQAERLGRLLAPAPPDSPPR